MERRAERIRTAWKASFRYPNPSNGRFVVSHGLEQGELEVYSMQGRTVHQERIEGSGKLMLELEGADAGLYLLLISRNGATLHKEKLILRE